jgi:hypothetical protein
VDNSSYSGNKRITVQIQTRQKVTEILSQQTSQVRWCTPETPGTQMKEKGSWSKASQGKSQRPYVKDKTEVKRARGCGSQGRALAAQSTTKKTQKTKNK